MRRPGAPSLLGAVISLLSLGAVAWWIAHQEAPRLPSSVGGFAWLAVALGISAVTLSLRGWRWHRIMLLVGVAHRRADAYGLTLVAYMGNTALPARGGDLLKIGLLGARSPARRREILGTVVAERLLDAVVLASIFAVLTWVGVEGAASGRGSATVVAAVLAACAVGLGTYLRLRRAGHFQRFAAVIRPVARASKLFARREGVALGLLSLVIWTLEGLTFLVIARAVDVQLGVLSSIAVVAIASLFAAIPAAPGYVGTFDAGILVGLHAAGVMGGDAVGVLLLTRFMLFVPVTIAGFVTLVVVYGGRLRRATPGGASLTRAPPDNEKLLAEEPPREWRRQVAAGERGARG